MIAETKIETEFKKIETHKPETELRILRRAQVGTIAQQGDVYLHRVVDDHPRGAELGTRQIALGTSVGARHVAEGKGVTVFAGKAMPPWYTEPAFGAATQQLGPVIAATERFRVTHPEHPHHNLPPGTWQVTYPWDHVAMRRVQD